MKLSNSTQHIGHISFERPLKTANDVIEWNKFIGDYAVIFLCGRSNVGKSSFINSLFQHKMAKTSKTPGRTQQINLFRFNLLQKYQISLKIPLFVADLPGYGHAKISAEQRRNWDELMAGFFSTLPSSALLINIQDARHPFEKSDIDFMNFIKKMDCEKVLVLNKYDKLKTQKERTSLAQNLKELSKKAKMFKQFFMLSAHTNLGMEEFKQTLLNVIYKWEGR